MLATVRGCTCEACRGGVSIRALAIVASLYTIDLCYDQYQYSHLFSEQSTASAPLASSGQLEPYIRKSRFPLRGSLLFLLPSNVIVVLETELIRPVAPSPCPFLRPLMISAIDSRLVSQAVNVKVQWLHISLKYNDLITVPLFQCSLRA